ncbi:MAG: AAA family ATPase [Bacteroidaceae bacterium]|nr:AAA family ATPase [Bacteroidaceae bacterium]
MIDSSQNLIMINGVARTKTIESCVFERTQRKICIVFKGSTKQYFYKPNSIVWLQKTIRLNPHNYHIRHKGILCQNIAELLEFSHIHKKYYHIKYISGTEIDYADHELEIEKSCLEEEKSKNVFEYFREIAENHPLETEEGKKILAFQYRSMDFLPDNLAIAPYLYPEKYHIQERKRSHFIFPFGCNTSQLKAIQKAFRNQISVIQGPPGTGKTQTILNIIANILMNGQTVLVVSNNNSATNNISEKLAKYGMDFFVAPLGCSDNKTLFIKEQKQGRTYPSVLYTWMDKEADMKEFKDSITQDIVLIEEIYTKHENLALYHQQLNAIELEWEHFKNEMTYDFTPHETNTPSEQILQLLNQQQERLENKSITKWKRLKWWFRKIIYRYLYKIDEKLLEQTTQDIIRQTQALFYIQKIKELKNNIELIQQTLQDVDASFMMKNLSDKSIRAFKNILYKKYAHQHEAYTINEESMRQGSSRVLDEFPVVLSTTFSARNSLPKVTFDYIIMDEASQVSIETGVIALSCARNAVIVGDTMQLPNVVSKEEHKKFDTIRNKYNISDNYNCATKSFLQSVIDVLPSVPQTLLREHYRCVPDIINFCNQKFYGGNLVIMTQNKNNAICAIKTVKGNHSRNHTNQREIDVICQEILPSLPYNPKDIGIIAPYNHQVDAIKKVVNKDIDVATIHKFQGREKDAIIMSVVDDKISEFADNPNLLNVAVSRAQKQFYLVVTGNEQTQQGNICDLLGYINYHKGTISTSRIHSIFDLLYKQYTEARFKYLKEQKRISEFDSENLTYSLIKDVLASDQQWLNLDVICHYPLCMLLKDYSALNDEECKYASHYATHVDFLIYNRVTKAPILAIEVDGWKYHQKGSHQAKRDRMKDSILSIYGIELIRLSTTGSGERNIIKNSLKQFYS